MQQAEVSHYVCVIHDPKMSFNKRKNINTDSHNKGSCNLPKITGEKRSSAAGTEDCEKLVTNNFGAFQGKEKAHRTKAANL